MKNKMYFFTALLLGFTVLFSSCSKSDDYDSQVVINLAQEQYGVPLSNEVEVKLLSTVNLSSSTTVQYQITSNLVEGEDYTLSAKEFSFTKDSRETSIVVSFLKQLNDSDKLELKLMTTTAGSLGLSTTTISLQDSEALIYTFDNDSYIMTESVELTFSLSDLKGSYVAEEDLTFEVELDPASTAIEGTHFSFEKDNKIVVSAGSSKGKIKLNLVKQEADKDLIKLKLKNVPAQLKAGNFDMADIIIFGSQYAKMLGAWKYKAFTNDEWLEMNTAYFDEPETLPRNNSEKDSLIFTEFGLRVAMEGDLRNYFRDTKLSYKKEEAEVLQELPGFPPKRVNIALVSGMANVAFSKSTEVERIAEIGFRVFEEGNEEILEVTIRDYEPVDFLVNTYEMYKTFGDTPVMKTSPLRFHFVKVK